MPLQEVCEALRRSRDPIVLTHHNADLDAMASALALVEAFRGLGVGAKVASPQSVSRRAQRIAEGYGVLASPDLAGHDAIVIVDTSTMEQLAPIVLPRGNIILIDHHISNNLSEVAKVAYIDENAASVAEMVWEIIRELGVQKTPKMAELIACGILAETANFRYAKKGTFSLFAQLLDSVDYGKIQELISSPIDVSERIARLRAAGRARVYRLGDFMAAFSEVGSFEASAARALLSAGADIAVVSCCKDKEIRISARGSGEVGKRIDLAKDVFAKIGDVIGGAGGGHPLAASANGSRPESLLQANKRILQLLEERLGKAKEIT